MKVRISASALDKFFTCPRQYKLSRTLTPLGRPSEELQRGIEVHALLAGERITPTIEDVGWYVKQIKSKEKDYTIFLRETEQIIDYTPGVTIVRRHDGLGVHNPSGEEVVVDYKTAGWQWDVTSDIAPKAHTFQSAIYLLGNDMPDRMDYIVASSDGVVKVFTVYEEQELFQNLYDAIDMVLDAHLKDKFPKHEGWLCRFCDFFDPCHKVQGWQSNFKQRGDRR